MQHAKPMHLQKTTVCIINSLTNSNNERGIDKLGCVNSLICVCVFTRLRGVQGLSHPTMPHSQFIKEKIFHKSKVTNRLCNVITLVTAFPLIDSYTYILSDYHNVFLWDNSSRVGERSRQRSK